MRWSHQRLIVFLFLFCFSEATGAGKKFFYVDTYKPSGKNCEMPPRTIITAVARLTIRLRRSATC